MRKIVFILLAFCFLSGSISAAIPLTESEMLKFKYESNNLIEDMAEQHIFTGCYEGLEKEINEAAELNIGIVEELEELELDYAGIESEVRGGSNPKMAENVITDIINLKKTNLDSRRSKLLTQYNDNALEIQERLKQFNRCKEKEQEKYDELLKKYQDYLTSKDYRNAIYTLSTAKTLVYSNTKYSKYLEDSLKYVKELKFNEEAKKIDDTKTTSSEKTPSKTTTTSAITLSDADILANAGIVTKQDRQEKYNLQSLVLRQEVIGMAIKLAGITLPTEYTCKNIFRDVSAAKPNNWVCRSVEIGVERGIVSGANKNFNPESNITRAEALAILMNAAGIKTQESTVSKFADVTVPWQINIVNTAFSYSFIDMATNFYPNKNATRGEIFNMAKRILKSKS